MIDEQGKDILQDLGTSEIRGNDLSNNERHETSSGDQLSGLVIQAQQGSLTSQTGIGLKEPCITEANGDDIVEPASYAEAIAGNQCLG